jgi:hypothetical protein
LLVYELRLGAWTRKHDDPRFPLIPQAPRIVYPTTLPDLITMCRNRPAGERLKAAGSHWALSVAAISDHTFIETQDPRGRYPAMDRTLHEVVPACLHPELLDRMADSAFPTRHGTLVHVEAGKRIFQLYAELDQVDPLADKKTLGGHMRDRFGMTHFAGPWGFETLGGAGGQTVVGALTTGTHGGDFDRPPIADSVVAIHLVADGGKHYWIERVDERYHPQLVDDHQLAKLYGSTERGGPDNEPDSFEIIRDPDNKVFNAVLVSAGRFGVIYSIVLRAVPQYSLWERRRLHVWQDVKKQITDRNGPLFVDTAAEAPGAACRFLQVVVCLTPHLNFQRNLAGVTKRWTIPADQAPGGRPERIGARTDRPDGQNPVFAKAGASFPYTPDENNPYAGEEPGMLDRACANAGFLAGIIDEAIAELEEFVESNGAAVGAGITAVAAAGGAGLLALIPWLLLVLVVLKELLEEFDSDDRLGEHMERIKNSLLDPNEPDPAKRAAGLLAWQLIAYMVFESMQGDLQFGALSFAVMDRKNYLDRSCEHNVDSVEVFFDATDDRLVAFVDALIAFEINQELRGKAFLGYVSLRFTGPTGALIGMQKHATTCSIEVAGLKDLTGSAELVEYAERLARNPNIRGVLHWGQRNGATRAEVELRFGDGPTNPGGDLGDWRQALSVITENGRLDGFSNDFSRRAGLEVV